MIHSNRSPRQLELGRKIR